VTGLPTSHAPRVVQSDLFGRDKIHRTAVKLAKSVPSIRATDLMTPVPLLDPLSQRQGRGRPTQRPIGMSQSTWMYWLRWCARHQIDHAAAEAMPEFLASHRAWKLNVARHRMSDASHDQPQHVWRTIRLWKDITAAEEAEWRRRIRRGTTEGTYRIGLRGLQRLEVAR
jgi:hypothetical protein